MKKLISIGCLLAATGLHAQTPWLTVLGNPEDPAINTIEVNPSALTVRGDLRTMQIRVSRSVQRTSSDGISFRSFEADVVFDCAKDTARFETAVFYREPLWKGASHMKMVYSESPVRKMEFRDVYPNPRTRIVRAACQSASVTAN